MRTEPSQITRPSGWRRWRVARWLLLGVLLASGYGAWRETRFRSAIKQAESLGWEWHYDDPFATIQRNWRAVFDPNIWRDGRRDLEIVQAEEFARHFDVVRRLAPRSLKIEQAVQPEDLGKLKKLRQLHSLSLVVRPSLANTDELADLTSLRRLVLRGCTNLVNVNGLEKLTRLEFLDLGACSGITNIDGLRNLTALKWLSLSGNTKLANIEVLQGLTALEDLFLEDTRISSVNALKSLQNLKKLDLSDCANLENVDGLRSHKGLEWLDLYGCAGLKNVDGLSQMSFRRLELSGCCRLTNVDGLAGITSLDNLDLQGCTDLENLNGILSLPMLSRLDLRGCTRLKPEAIAALKAKLPNIALVLP